jgi:hypothetical protein
MQEADYHFPTLACDFITAIIISWQCSQSYSLSVTSVVGVLASEAKSDADDQVHVTGDDKKIFDVLFVTCRISNFALPEMKMNFKKFHCNSAVYFIA